MVTLTMVSFTLLGAHFSFVFNVRFEFLVRVHRSAFVSTANLNTNRAARTEKCEPRVVTRSFT